LILLLLLLLLCDLHLVLPASYYSAQGTEGQRERTNGGWLLQEGR
jgi:hypothetical protein